jgi:glutathione S-transferase
MQLVGISLSPYFERAVITLDAKGALDQVELKLPAANLGTPEAKAVNPTGKIPYLLLDDGSFLPEGQVIAEYFDDVFGGPSLMPRDPVQAAKAKLLCRTIDLYVGPHTSSLARTITRGVRDEAAIAHALSEGLPLGIDLLESHISSDTFAVGESFSFGDVALIPHMFHFLTFLKEFNISVFEGRPKLTAWWERHKESDIVKNSHARMMASLQFLIERARAQKEQAAAR